MKSLIDIIRLVNGDPTNIVITMHRNPDADAMGSSLALTDYLVRKGHDVTVVSPNEFPDFLKWMPGCAEVLVFESQQSKALEALQNAKTLFCLDFNNLSRTGHFASFLEESKITKVLIDHHLHPQDVFDYGKSDPSAASTALMIYEFVTELGDKSMINLAMAKCIYAGTMTDTGSFRFPATSARVHRMIAELMDIGLDHEEVHRAIYDNYSENRLRFIGKVLLDHLEVLYEYNAAVISVPQNMIHKFELKPGDTEGLVNLPLSIKGIKLAILITDRKGEMRMSFRSKGDFNVNHFAKKYFEGGGHKNAAGGCSSNSLEKTVDRLKKALEENKDLLN